MSDFLQRIKTDVLIGTGAMSTNLALRGYNQSENDSLWALEHQDIYRDMLKTWVDIGCDYIYLGFGSANWFRLKEFGLQDRMREINYKLAEIARQEIPASCYFAYTISAAGLVLPPMGDASPDKVYESYAEQVRITKDLGVDVFEAQGPDIEQFNLALRAVKDNCNLPLVGLVHSFFPTPKGFRTMIGVDPVKGAKNMEAMGADVIGTLCGGLDYQQTSEVLRQMASASNKPIIAKPNAGVPHVVDDKTIQPRTPEEMAAETLNWIKAGARIICGCCGTTPEHIRKAAEVIRKYRKASN